MILIIVGFYFGFDVLIILGVILTIDGIFGLLIRRKIEKKEGDRIAGSVTLLSFGLFIMFLPIFNFTFGSSDIFLLMGLAFLLIGVIGLFFAVRKHQKMKTLEKNDAINRESKIEQSLKKPLTEKKIGYARSVEDIIFDYLKENKGKAFTSKSLHQRCEEIKELDMTVDDIKNISDNLTAIGKIGSHEKEGEIFYYAL